jgi:hypothetical protein
MTAQQAHDAGLETLTATMDLSELARPSTDGTFAGLLVLLADRARGVLIGAGATFAQAYEVPLRELAARLG